MPETPFAPLPWKAPIRPAELASRKPTQINITPDAATRKAIAQWADISALKRLSLKGTMTPAGRTDWTLEAVFEAEVVQPCVVSLAPVTTTLKEPVLRRYIAGYEEPTADETEVPDDTSIERLPPVIDLAQVALETLELALPLYPRAPDAEDAGVSAAEPDADPAPSAHPFADLRRMLEKDPKDPGETS